MVPPTLLLCSFDQVVGQGYQGHQRARFNMEGVLWSGSGDGTGALGQGGEGSGLKEWTTWWGGGEKLEVWITIYILLANRTYCTAQGTILNIL